MPNTSSAKKRLRQNVARRDRNRAARSTLRSQLRKVHQAVKEGDAGKAQQELILATKKLDQAGAARLIHPNKAARTKSRLNKLVKLAKQANA